MPCESAAGNNPLAAINAVIVTEQNAILDTNSKQCNKTYGARLAGKNKIG
jgi:hypothetical protein